MKKNVHSQSGPDTGFFEEGGGAAVWSHSECVVGGPLHFDDIKTIIRC